MNYEQKYKDTIERAKKELEACGSMECYAAKQLFRLFPELRESEDEKIRKAIIGTLPKYGYLPQTTIKVEDALAWVEKQGEQKQEWSEEDDYNLQCMIAKVTSDIQKGNVGRNNELIDWLKSIKERVQPQPKQEWSEEDKEMLDRIDDSLEAYATKVRSEKDYELEEILKEEQSWLYSLKDRILPQPMQEWSEEDEKKRNLLINILNVNHPNGYFKANPANTLNMEAIHTEELVSWLKSIKEKVQPKQEWSDEDEFRLNRTVENIELLNDANGDILFKDIEWLKSLKNRLSKVKNC